MYKAKLEFYDGDTLQAYKPIFFDDTETAFVYAENYLPGNMVYHVFEKVGNNWEERTEG